MLATLHPAFEALQSILQSLPILGLFLSIGIGFFAGKFQVGSFQLGGIAGSLLVAVVISQLGVSIDPSLGSLLFALFIYAVGFESGPHLFASLGRKTLREITLAVFLAVTSLITVLVLAKWQHLDKGMAAGIAAGALTQSAMIGTASAALAKVGLSQAALDIQQAHIAVGYAVTYIFGSLGAIIICTTLLPMITRRSIHDDAQLAENTQSKTSLVGDIGDSALPDIIGRVFIANTSVKVDDLEREEVRVEAVSRGNKAISTSRTMSLEKGDKVLLLGPREAVHKYGETLGVEDLHSKDNKQMNVALSTSKCVPNKKYFGQSWSKIIKSISGDNLASVWVVNVKRDGKLYTAEDAGAVEANDVASLYGLPIDLKRIVKTLGTALTTANETNYIFHGIGVAVGLLLGMIVLHPFGIPLTLGSGGGAMISGLVFGWWQGKRPALGGMSEGASSFCVQFGLAGFVAVVGLNSGAQAIQTIVHDGVTLFALGCVITMLPLFLTLLFGWFVLKYTNAALFAGALSGTRSANPAFGQVLQAAGNNTPGVPFAITYAVANVLLTLLGPLIVALA